MRLCPHIIPLDGPCPRCEAIERKAQQDRETAALDHMVDRDCERERATGEWAGIRDERIMGGGR